MMLHVSRRSGMLSSRSSKSRSSCTWTSWTKSLRPALRRTSSARTRTRSASPETILHHSNCSFVRLDYFLIRLFHLQIKTNLTGWCLIFSVLQLDVYKKWSSALFHLNWALREHHLMQLYALLLLQLEERKTENEAMCESHREKIQQLWDRLQVPQDEREAFNEHMVTSRKRNLEAVRRFKRPVCPWPPSLLIFSVIHGQLRLSALSLLYYCSHNTWLVLHSYKQKFSVWRSSNC